MARITLKTLDYYKFRKLIIDGNRDDYAMCSKEVKTLCDFVQTLNCRDEQFDEELDRGRLDTMCCYYRQILASKRVDPIDMRIKSGWWANPHAGSYSVGKIKPSALKDVLLGKARDWARRHTYKEKDIPALLSKFDGPGLFVFKHREKGCFQYVGRAEKIFTRCSELLKSAYEGTVHDPVAALFTITLANDWDFYFTPVLAADEERLLRILLNDTIIRHDCIWPHGLNFRLQIETTLEVSEFRRSCTRHKWPPAHTGSEVTQSLDLERLRHTLSQLDEEEELSESTKVTPVKAPEKPNPLDARPEFVVPGLSPEEERSPSPLSDKSSATYVVDNKVAVTTTSSVVPKPVMFHIPSAKGKENVKVTAKRGSKSAGAVRTSLSGGLKEVIKEEEADVVHVKQIERPTELPIQSTGHGGQSPKRTPRSSASAAGKKK